MKLKHFSKIVIVCNVLLLSVVSCNVYAQKIEDSKERPLFKVKKATAEIVVDGKMDEADWKKSTIRSFDNVYLVEKPTDIQKTNFRMLWDDETIYLFYESEDKYITARETLRDGMPFFDDCAEFFVIPSPESGNAHICFEVNLNKAVNDIVYVSDFYKGGGLPIKGYNPVIKVGVQIKGTVNDNSDIDTGWSMEFAIPKEAFKGAERYFSLQEGTQWAFLALRQDRNEVEGERRVISTIFPVENVKDKDVHQPTMFGLLEFVNE